MPFSTRRAFLGALLALSALPLFAAEFKSDRITVRTEGSGSDVVLVHGLSSSTRVWAEMIKAVPGHRYHLVQMNGFAGFAPGANAHGLVSAPVAEEIARYIAESKLDKPALIGHSMGGSIGLMIAARHPHALSKLMVVDMVPFLGAFFGPPGTTPASIKPFADAMEKQQLEAAPEVRRARVIATINSMIENEAMRPAAIEDGLSSDRATAAHAYHELVVTDLQPELSAIKAPTTVLYVVPKGAPFTEPQISGIYKIGYVNLKCADLKFVPHSAHFIMWDAPQRFHEEVREFLK